MPNNQTPLTSSLKRAPVVRGLEKHEGAIDPLGGLRSAGVIRGMAIVTRGEASGHDYWLDETFVSQTHKALNQLSKGAKSRFTHPSLSGSGLGKFLGRTYKARLDGDVVRADLHFSPTAHSTPEGNLAQYVMDLAEEDPAAFGTSIVFMNDYEAEEKHYADHGGSNAFKSPDPLNKKNLRHARLKVLRAVDVVDDPAANPSGLFHRDDLHADAESLLAYVTGQSTDLPQFTALSSLAIEPNRITTFIKTYLDRHGLEITKKKEETDMPKTTTNTKQQTDDQQQNQSLDDSQQPGDKGANDPKQTDDSQQLGDQQDDDPQNDNKDGESQQSAGQQPGDQLSAQDQCKRYVEAFGAQGGVWFSEGLSFEDAQKKHTEALQADNQKLRQQLELAKGSEIDPLSSGGAADSPQAKEQNRLATSLGNPLANYAASLKLGASNN